MSANYRLMESSGLLLLSKGDSSPQKTTQIGCLRILARSNMVEHVLKYMKRYEFNKITSAQIWLKEISNP
jgi:hypothetical protein